MNCCNPLLSGLAASLILAPLTGMAMQPERERELENLLVHDCGSCHGTRLRGGLGPPLTSERMRGLPEAWIVEAILEGRNGTAMPPWNALLSTEDAAWIARRLQTGMPR
jgi:cytochrome c55X